MKRILFAPLLVVALIAAPTMGADLAQVSLPNARQEAEAIRLMDNIRCVVCQGQPISGSNADLAGDMRRLVRERIAAGDSPDQVRAYLVSRYGDWVSFQPSLRPATAPLWLIPLLALIAGGWLASLKMRRR